MAMDIGLPVDAARAAQVEAARYPPASTAALSAFM